MDSNQLYSHCEDEVKRHDPARYLCMLLFPDDARRKLMPLFAFNHEIASIAGMVSEPMIGAIRLSWWKEGIDEIYAGKVREHPVLQALAELIKESKLAPGWHHPLIAARERDVNKQPFATVNDLYVYCEQTSSVLLGVAAQVLGAAGHEHHEAITVIGRAWAISGLLRATPVLAKEGRCVLPLDILQKAGSSMQDVFDETNLAKVVSVISLLAELELKAIANNRKKPPSEIKHFVLFLAHSKWWLSRILSHRGNVYNPGVKSGKFFLLSKLWFASKCL